MHVHVGDETDSAVGVLSFKHRTARIGRIHGIQQLIVEANILILRIVKVSVLSRVPIVGVSPQNNYSWLLWIILLRLLMTDPLPVSLF